MLSVAVQPEYVAQSWRSQERLAQPTDELRAGVSVVLCTYRRPESVRRFIESLAIQTRMPDEFLVVDASSDAATEVVVRGQALASDVKYWRVDGPLRGLTRQRNFALHRIACDLVAFFDDDVVLDAHCLERLEHAHRARPDLAGVGCFAEGFTPPTRLWRIRRALRMIPDLRPGSYTLSGMSVPWRFHPLTNGLVEGDWLPGCAMMLKTRAATDVLFNETLTGYAQGEDLEFSLRLRQRGRLALLGDARCEHLHEPAGRPDAFRLGEMEIWNRYRIWRQVHRPPTARAQWHFAYAWSLDTLMLVRDAIRPSRARDGVRRIAGRMVGAAHILRNRAAH